MKQITIYCSEELDPKVDQILHRNGIEEFFTIAGMYATRLKEKDSFERDQAWPANAIIVYPDETQFAGLLADLKAYAQQCVGERCLRIVTSPAERIC